MLINPPVVASDKPTAALYQTYSRALAVNNLAMSSGVLMLSGIWLPQGLTVSSVTFCSMTTALSTPSHGWGALFTPSRVLMAQSANDTGISWAANTAKTFTLAAPVTTAESGWFYAGVMVVATTVPTLAGLNPNVGVSFAAPGVGGWSTSGLTTTAPGTAAAPASGNTYGYAYVS